MDTLVECLRLFLSTTWESRWEFESRHPFSPSLSHLTLFYFLIFRKFPNLLKEKCRCIKENRGPEDASCVKNAQLSSTSHSHNLQVPLCVCVCKFVFLFAPFITPFVLNKVSSPRFFALLQLLLAPSYICKAQPTVSLSVSLSLRGLYKYDLYVVLHTRGVPFFLYV